MRQLLYIQTPRILTDSFRAREIFPLLTFQSGARRRSSARARARATFDKFDQSRRAREIQSHFSASFGLAPARNTWDRGKRKRERARALNFIPSMRLIIIIDFPSAPPSTHTARQTSTRKNFQSVPGNARRR